jgi:hypothetical protein
MLVAPVGATAAAWQSAPSAGCRADYTVEYQWPGGFVGRISVVNTGAPLASWQVGFTFGADQEIVQAWNAEVTQAGSSVTIRNGGGNVSVPTNGSVRVGFLGTFSASNPVPTGFSLNGLACDDGTGPAPAQPSRSAAPTSTPSTPSTRVAPTTRPTMVPGSAEWNPSANLAPALDRVWNHMSSTYGNLNGFKNYGWDQIIANKGTFNYCVRWDSSKTVTAAQRDQIHAALGRQMQKWADAMTEYGQGWNGFPYPKIDVKVVGWAVRDRAQLQWNDNSVDVYVGDIRENAPQCAEPCGRFFHQNSDYSACPGGPARHYDLSLWLTDGFGGGAGGDWGQRVGTEYFLSNLNADNIHIWLHEMGHTWGLDDFYDWDPGVGGFLMKAASASRITEFDQWMARDFWRHMKGRYGL